ncbi:hypothetical protein L7F22_058705 [Adiantum nelumboides]|nr:hypothetical protein [Adiantum nelumboides]
MDGILLTDEGEPLTFKEAQSCEDKSKWELAMKFEMQSLYANNTWELVPLPKGKKAILNKWVYKVKCVDDKPKHKARLVAKGYAQMEGIDFHEIFSPVVKMTTLHVLFALCAILDLELDQMDVVTAFLHGDLDEELYMQQLECFVISKKEYLVCKLKCNLYGLKQALKQWYVMARPAGERCLVVSSNGTTVSRLRNGRIHHCFPSALPNGARTHEAATSSQVFCILDCIFYKPDNIYYVIDIMCWRGYSLYDCTYEFRQFWIKSKLEETGVLDAPSKWHRYQFQVVPTFECDKAGLQEAYNGIVPFERDGCLFLNRHAHYILGVTPLSLLWKDPATSRYHIDTDSKGDIPAYQQIVLEYQEDGTVATCDDPKVVFGSLPQEFLRENNQHLQPGILLKFVIGDQGLTVVDGRPVTADIHYQGVANRYRAGADSVSKVLFQYSARHCPLTISSILAAIETSKDDFEMDHI